MKTAHLEVVRVVSPGFFVNADDEGYYLVVRSIPRVGATRAQNARFYGPLPTAAQAIFLAVSAHALGLTSPGGAATPGRQENSKRDPRPDARVSVV